MLNEITKQFAMISNEINMNNELKTFLLKKELSMLKNDINALYDMQSDILKTYNINDINAINKEIFKKNQRINIVRAELKELKNDEKTHKQAELYAKRN